MAINVTGVCFWIAHVSLRHRTGINLKHSEPEGTDLVEDELAIRHLVATYSDAVSRRDQELWNSTFNFPRRLRRDFAVSS